MRIAFLGLGNMGLPMARNILDQGHELIVYNRTPGRAGALVAKGASEASSPKEAVKDVSVAITMLSSDRAVEAIALGKEGLVQSLPIKAIHLCMSTISVQLSKRLELEHSKADQGYVAAPIFGRPGAASSRHLWIVAAGPELHVNRCLPIFDAVARGLTRVGSRPEVAHAVKLGGSVFTLALVEALSEVLAFGEKAGVPPVEYMRLLNTALFKSPMLDAYGGLMTRGAYTPASLPIEMAGTELSMALQASEALNLSSPLVDLLIQRTNSARNQGFGALDVTALSKVCRMAAGLEGDVTTETPSTPEPLHSEASPEPQKASEAPIPLAVPIEPPAPPQKPPTVPPVNPAPIPTAVEIGNENEYAPATEPTDPQAPGEMWCPYKVFDGEKTIVLDLERTSHFELVKRTVWAWSQEKRYRTSWSNLAEVELAFRHILFLPLQNHILLRPEAVLEIKPGFAGRGKLRVGNHLELDANRASLARLKELLGI